MISRVNVFQTDSQIVAKKYSHPWSIARLGNAQKALYRKTLNEELAQLQVQLAELLASSF